MRQLRKGSSRSSVLSDTLEPSVYEEVIRLSKSRKKSLRVKEKAKKRARLLGTSVGSSSAQAQRQRAWLMRASGAVEPSAWKPREYHRGSAKKWLQAMDSQLQACDGRYLA